jgi:hypothetical protein
MQIRVFDDKRALGEAAAAEAERLVRGLGLEVARP